MLHHNYIGIMNQPQSPPTPPETYDIYVIDSMYGNTLTVIPWEVGTLFQQDFYDMPEVGSDYQLTPSNAVVEYVSGNVVPYTQPDPYPETTVAFIMPACDVIVYVERM